MGLEDLWRWQEMLASQHRLEQELQTGEPVKQLKAAQEKREALWQALKEEREQLRRLEMEIKRKKAELNERQTKYEALKTSLYGGKVRNPKELSGIERQAAKMQTEIQSQEEELLELMVAQEEREALLAQKEEAFQKAEASLAKKKQAYESWKEEKEKVRAEVIREKEARAVTVEENLFKLFNRLTGKLGDQVVVKVEEDFCGGCHVKLSTLVLENLKREELVRCESCGRVLFIPN